MICPDTDPTPRAASFGPASKKPGALSIDLGPTIANLKERWGTSIALGHSARFCANWGNLNQFLSQTSTRI